MKEEILAQAIERLKDTKKEIIDRIHSYEEEIKKYKESNKELEDDLSTKVYNEKTDRLMNNIKACETAKDNASFFLKMFKEQRQVVKEIISYNLILSGEDEFYNLVSKVKGIKVNEMYNELQKFAKPTQIPFPFKSSELAEINNIIGFTLIKVDTSFLNSIKYLGGNYLEKAKEIKMNLNNPKLISFYDKIIKYFTDVLKRIDNISRESGEEIQKIRAKEIKRRKDEINNNIEEINRKIDECKKSLVSIGEIYNLYDDYKQNKNQEILIKLTEELTNLVVISQRESKIIKHEEKYKIEELVPEENKIEKTVEKVEQKEVNVLDNDYFRRNDTKHIICFLGEENDSIREDIMKHFDNSSRKPVLSELYGLFNSLTVDTDFIKDKGGNPHSGSAKNALALLKKPFDFEYRRYGVRNDGFRIHAISRYSSLLKDLGYGSGKIIFFGAIGVNDDKLKSDAYGRLGKRAIEERSDKGKAAKLRPNFDYIEHITRRYIPIKLLSEDDKSILNNTGFNSKAKGNIDSTIENKKYVLYDILDDTSKNNVKEYLDEYFINQTTMLFEIINDYKKGNTLD